MNRVLKRPMFRRGGSADGITSGLDQKPRQEYSRGTTPNFQLGGLPGFLTGFGLNLLAEPPRGNIFQTAAVAARDPFNELQRFQTAQAVREEDIAREDKKLAEGRAFTEAMTDKEIAAKAAETDKLIASREKIADMDKGMSLEDLTQLYLPDYQGEANAEIKASNRARYTKIVLPELRANVGDTQIGGIIEFDRTDTKAAKRFAKQNKNKVGKVFYDINTGQTVILSRDPETNALGFVPYEVGMDTRSKDDETDIQPDPESTRSFGILSDRQKEIIQDIKDASDSDFGLGFYDGSQE